MGITSKEMTVLLTKVNEALSQYESGLIDEHELGGALLQHACEIKQQAVQDAFTACEWKLQSLATMIGVTMIAGDLQKELRALRVEKANEYIGTP